MFLGGSIEFDRSPRPLFQSNESARQIANRLGRIQVSVSAVKRSQSIAEGSLLAPQTNRSSCR